MRFHSTFSGSPAVPILLMKTLGGAQPQTQLPLPTSNPLLLEARQSGKGREGLGSRPALPSGGTTLLEVTTHTGKLTVQAQFPGFWLGTASLSAPPPWSPGGHGVKGSDSRQCSLHSGPGS